jgi:excisionase family DNA binding protein
LEEVSMALVFTKKSETQARPAASPPTSLMSVREAANYYHVSQQTVRRLIKAGKLKTYRVGRQIRIDLSDLFTCMSSS